MVNQVLGCQQHRWGTVAALDRAAIYKLFLEDMQTRSRFPALLWMFTQGFNSLNYMAISLGSQVVHYGVQVEDRIVPKPEPRPIYPLQQQSR